MVGAAVLVVEVVGVFPHIESQKRLERAAERIAGICLLGNLQVSFFVGGKPYPAGTEESAPFFWNSALNASKLPKSRAMASASAPLGADSAPAGLNWVKYIV